MGNKEEVGRKRGIKEKKEVRRVDSGNRKEREPEAGGSCRTGIGSLPGPRTPTQQR